MGKMRKKSLPYVDVRELEEYARLELQRGSVSWMELPIVHWGQSGRIDDLPRDIKGTTTLALFRCECCGEVVGNSLEMVREEELGRAGGCGTLPYKDGRRGLGGADSRKECVLHALQSAIKMSVYLG